MLNIHVERKDKILMSFKRLKWHVEPNERLQVKMMSHYCKQTMVNITRSVRWPYVLDTVVS